MLKNKPVILLDIDGVICNYADEVIHKHSLNYPDDQIAEITEYDMPKFFRHSKQMINDIMTDNVLSILEWATPYKDALLGYKILCQEFNIILATARGSGFDKNKKLDVMHITQGWLKINGFTCHQDLIFNHDKHSLPGDVLIDDCSANLNMFDKTGRLSICRDQTWNQDYKGFRVDTLIKTVPLIHTYFHYKEQTEFTQWETSYLSA